MKLPVLCLPPSSSFTIKESWKLSKYLSLPATPSVYPSVLRQSSHCHFSRSSYTDCSHRSGSRVCLLGFEVYDDQTKTHWKTIKPSSTTSPKGTPLLFAPANGMQRLQLRPNPSLPRLLPTPAKTRKFFLCAFSRNLHKQSNGFNVNFGPSSGKIHHPSLLPDPVLRRHQLL